MASTVFARLTIPSLPALEPARLCGASARAKLARQGVAPVDRVGITPGTAVSRKEGYVKAKSWSEGVQQSCHLASLANCRVGLVGPDLQRWLPSACGEGLEQNTWAGTAGWPEEKQFAVSYSCPVLAVAS